jgi:multidrug efflux pump subunit AcrB
MQTSGVTFDDIANAVSRENMDISGGLLDVGSMKRNLQLKGQFKTAYDIEQVLVRNTGGAPYLFKRHRCDKGYYKRFRKFCPARMART